MWSHALCNGVGKSAYSKLVEEDDELPWYCLPCLILSNSEVFPFGFLSKPELCDLLGVDLPSLFEHHMKLFQSSLRCQIWIHLTLMRTLYKLLTLSTTKSKN